VINATLELGYSLKELDSSNNLQSNKIEAILFDLSGTLVNDLSAVYQGYVDLCKKYNKKSPSLTQFREEFRLPYPDFLSDEGFKEIKDAIYFWKNAYTTYSSSISIFPDVVPALENLRKQDSIKLGVVSQTPKEQVEDNLHRFDLEDFFDNIILDRWKPKPKGLLLALEELNIKSAQNVIYIGDMKEDCEAARAADIKPWAIYREKGSFQALETIKKGSPTKIIRDLKELNALIFEAMT